LTRISLPGTFPIIDITQSFPDFGLMNKNWSRTTRILVISAGVIGLIYLVITFTPLVQALVIGALLAYLLDPLVHWLTKRTRFNRLWAARVVYVLFLLLLGGLPAILSTVAVTQFGRWSADFYAALTELRGWVRQPVDLLGFQFQPLALLNNLEETGFSTFSSAALALRSVTTNLLWGLTALVSLYYFLVDAPKIKPNLVGLVSPEYQTDARILLDEIDEVWRVFLRAQIIIFIIFVALLGSSMALVVGLYRSGLLPLSPIGLAVLLLAVYTIVQNIDNIIVRPYFFGESLKLHPGVVFVGLIAGLAFGGVLGVIIIIPAIATAKVIGLYIHRRLLGVSPWPHLEETWDEDYSSAQLLNTPKEVISSRS
jgi:predicted PurR-regulated permease PerM